MAISRGVAQQGKDEAALMQIEKEGCAVMIKPDPARIAAIYADDVTVIGSRGRMSTKTDVLAPPTADTRVDACVDENIKIKVYGDAAVVTALGTRSGVYRGTPYKDRKIYYVDTFIRRAGCWQLVASGSTLVAEQQK